MFVASNFVPLLLAIVLSFPESETATTVFSIKPSDPSFAVEGREFTLKWTYTLDGTLVLSNFFIVSDSGAAELIGKAIGPGNATFETKYQERFRAQATNTQAKLTILSVQRSDDPKYRIAVTPSGAGILTDDVAVIVQYQPFFTFISGNQTVNIGDVVWLNHTTGGFPEPNITWTRLSTNKIVSMPLTITGKQDEGFYRCTADNGIGINATADVFVTVQYQPNLTFISVNQTVNDGDTVWLSCTADGFPVPTITWTRLFTNRIVSMPLSITGKQDEGFYRCITDNGIGNPATADVFVTVQFYRPFSTEFSTNLTNAALLKETFYLMCSAEANPAAEYRLYKEDESVANVTARGQNIGLYATFAVDRVNQTVYKCIPFNSFGDGPTKAVPIIVNYPVQRRGSGNNFTEVEGVAKTFTCPVDGNPEPNITWYSEKTGRKISNEKQYQTGESGCYTCIASNSLGTPVIITQCLIVDPNVTLAPTTTVLQRSPTMAPSTTKPTSAEPGLAGLPWTIIGAVTGGVVVLVIGVSVLTWWVHKQRKCRKDSKSKDQTLLTSRRSHERHQQSSSCWPTYKRVISNV